MSAGAAGLRKALPGRSISWKPAVDFGAPGVAGTATAGSSHATAPSEDSLNQTRLRPSTAMLSGSAVLTTPPGAIGSKTSAPRGMS